MKGSESSFIALRRDLRPATLHYTVTFGRTEDGSRRAEVRGQTQISQINTNGGAKIKKKF